MPTKRKSTVVGVFRDRIDADRAVTELKAAGFTDTQIGIAAPFTEAESSDTDTKWEEGALTGALAGAGLGGLVGLGILAGVVPVLGPIIAGGALATILANAAGGAAIAGLVGALVGAGIPEDEATYYESEFKAGRTIVTVSANGRMIEAREILHRNGAYDMKTAGEVVEEVETTAAPMTTARARTATGQETIELHEERLHASKTPVQTGEVKVRKEVVTEHKTIDVPVEREEVVIERRPVGRKAASSSEIHDGEEIRIPVKEEKVVVSKEAVVTEEVTVGKRKVHDTEKVAGTVRKEQVKVERKGDVDVDMDVRRS